MNGVEVYKTHLAMMLHFNPNVDYDGWKYNFVGRAKIDSLNTDTRLKYMCAKLEKDFPTKVDQIKLMYPAWSVLKYVKGCNAGILRRHYNAFMKEMDDVVPYYSRNLDHMIEHQEVKDVNCLLRCDSLLPNICQWQINGRVPREFVILLSLVIPELLNSCVSKEPMVFDNWKTKILFDKKFWSLYLSQPVLKELLDITVAKFQNISKTGNKTSN